MTIERQNIMEDFYAGDHKVVAITVYEKDGVTRKNLSGCEITYALFDDDDTIFLRRSSAAGAAEINITDEPNGEVEVYLVSYLTVDLHGTYRHQMEVVDSNGHAAVVTTGKVNIFKAFARRYRTAEATAYLAGG